MIIITDSSSDTDMPQQCDLENLPDDLKIIVMDDNKKFTQEIDDWDKEQALKAAAASTSGVGGAASTSGGNGGGGDGDTASEQKTSKLTPSMSYRPVRLNGIEL